MSESEGFPSIDERALRATVPAYRERWRSYDYDDEDMDRAASVIRIYLLALSESVGKP